MTSEAQRGLGVYLSRIGEDEFSYLFDAIMEASDDSEFTMLNVDTGLTENVSGHDAKVAAASALTARAVYMLATVDDAEYDEYLHDAPDQAVSALAGAMLQALSATPSEDQRATLIARHPLMVAECERRNIAPMTFGDNDKKEA